MKKKSVVHTHNAYQKICMLCEASHRFLDQFLFQVHKFSIIKTTFQSKQCRNAKKPRSQRPHFKQIEDLTSDCGQNSASN